MPRRGRSPRACCRAAEVVLGVQRAVQGGPAVVDLADPVPVGQPDVAVEADVGGLVADGGQRLALEPGRAGRDQEHGHALVLGQRRVGPGDQEDVRGVLDVGGEDLLPVDDPLITVADRPGLGVGDVGPAVRLGIALGEPDRALGHTGLQLVAQPRVPVLLDRRPAPGWSSPSMTSRRQFGLEDLDAHIVQLGAAVFLPPARPQPALGAQREVKPLVVGGGPLAHAPLPPRGSGAHPGTLAPPRRTPADLR